MKAPMAKATNDEAAAWSGSPVWRGIDAQLLAGVGLEGELGVAHHLGRELGGHRGVEAPALVDGGQLLALVLGIVADGLPLDIELPEHELGLRPHRDVLAGGHREGPGDQSGDAGQAHRAGRGVGPGHAQDEGDVGDQAVADPEDGGAGSPALQVAMAVLAATKGSVPSRCALRRH